MWEEIVSLFTSRKSLGMICSLFRMFSKHKFTHPWEFTHAFSGVWKNSLDFSSLWLLFGFRVDFVFMCRLTLALSPSTLMVSDWGERQAYYVTGASSLSIAKWCASALYRGFPRKHIAESSAAATGCCAELRGSCVSVGSTLTFQNAKHHLSH